jgi:coproporphyrinogen III oxidase
METLKNKWITFIHQLQDDICKGLEEADGEAIFVEDRWERAEGGGGKTRIISNGKIFEKGGVNTSAVFGKVSVKMKEQLGMDGHEWFACGLSLVLHPWSPFIPTVHANWRYFELYNKQGEIIDQWFGGGTDLTPYYLFDEDATHFHQTLKDTITPFDKDLYDTYKKQCDLYFVNAHRNGETRGIGGVFYDHLKPQKERDAAWLFRFQEANGNSFLKAYLPILERRRNIVWNEAHKYWQEIRRGRYVEFNLIHDRGTIFGLKTNGRTESILMSLPPTVRFDYNYEPEPGTEEARLLAVCRHPTDWA